MKKYLVVLLLTCPLLAVALADAEDERIDWLDAAREGKLAIIKTMLQNGFDIETKSDSGNTALKIASKKNHFELIDYLIEQGADVNSRSTRNRSTPLHAAAYRGHYEVVQLLLKHGADISARNHNGNTPLSLAAKKNHARVVELLLQSGASLEVQNNKGATPLIMAAAHGSLSTTQLLLDKGADPLKSDNDGNNALQQYESGVVGDVLLGTMNATSIVLTLPQASVNDETFSTTIKTVLFGRGWQPEQKSITEFFAQLQKSERIFRIHIKRIGDNLLVEYVPGYGSNKKHFLNNIKVDLLSNLNLNTSPPESANDDF